MPDLINFRLSKDEISVLLCYHLRKLDEIDKRFHDCLYSDSFSMADREESLEHLYHATDNELKRVRVLKKMVHDISEE